MKVTKITLERLYNLGNYEHIRYGVSVDISEQDSAAQALGDLQAIIDDLRPNPISNETVRRAIDCLAEEHSDPAGYQSQPPEMRTAARKTIERHDRHNARIHAARAALDALGGEKRYTDAKQTWDDDEDTYF